MNRFRTPFDWEVPEKPRRSWGIESYFGMKVMVVDLCPDCTEDQRESKAIETKDLCPACRLAVERRW